MVAAYDVALLYAVEAFVSAYVAALLYAVAAVPDAAESEYALNVVAVFPPTAVALTLVTFVPLPDKFVVVTDVALTTEITDELPTTTEDVFAVTPIEDELVTPTTTCEVALTVAALTTFNCALAPPAILVELMLTKAELLPI